MSVISLTPPGKISLTALPSLSLYIHIPWCLKKCPYCDFNSHEAREAVPEKAYIAALRSDLEQALPQIWGRRVSTVFFGGGTPSLFSAEGIDEIIAAARMLLNLPPDTEITLEANPGTFEREKFQDFHAAGVNRLSLGIQSFNPAYLKALGRVHDAAQAREAAGAAREIFGRMNLDLIYGLPQQSVADLLADVETALSFRPDHLSCYHLTIEPNTLFHRYPPANLPDDEVTAQMQEDLEARLAAAGFEHYETSAFSLPQQASRHNLNYWRFGDYLGIGAGAHSKISFPDRIVRQMRHKQPRVYIDGVAAGRPVQEQHEIARADLPFEFMMNALRLTGGFPVWLFEERTGLPVSVIEHQLQQAETKDLIVRTHESIAPTPLGQRFLNELLQLFLD